jgi:hypothetical protein
MHSSKRPPKLSNSLAVASMSFSVSLSTVKEKMEGELDAILTPVTESQRATYESMQRFAGVKTRLTRRTERRTRTQRAEPSVHLS